MIQEYINEHYIYSNNEGEFAGIVTSYSADELNNMSILSYPDELLKAIGHILGKDASVVLYDLLVKENADKIVKVDMREDLVQALKECKASIFIPASICEAEKGHVKSKKDTSELDIFQMMFDKKSQDFKDLKSKLNCYEMRFEDASGYLIFEKEEV